MSHTAVFTSNVQFVCLAAGPRTRKMCCFRSRLVFNCCFKDNDILQGSVATHLRCGGTYSNSITSRLHRARGARAHHFYTWMCKGGTVCRLTANKKLTKLYWPSRKRSPKRLIVLLAPKSGGHDPKFFSGALRRTGAPLPTFKFVPAPLITTSTSVYFITTLNTKYCRL